MPRFKGEVREKTPIDQRIDTRRWTQRKADEWSSPDDAYILDIFLSVLNLFLIFLPLGSFVALLPSYLLSKNFLHPKLRLHDMPLRVPKYIKAPDGSKYIPNVPFKKNKAKYLGDGVTMFGIDLISRLQVWGTDSDDRTHSIILGTTGSGKTEFIYVMILNQLIQDSGFIFVDAKGDISAQKRICQLLRRFGREDDLLTITYAVGDRDFMEAQIDRPTNTFNIMSTTSAGMLIELLAGMLDDGGSGGDLWQGRAIAYIAALTRPLTYLRDKKEFDLSPSKFMEYMELAEIERLCYENDYKHANLDQVLKPLKGYLITLPGYNSEKRGKQETTTLEQFGYITMQLTRSLNDLSYNYGHIFGAETGEIDITDVVLNRRCLTVLLPSLERSPATLNMLGKLIIGSIKQMMAGSLGSRLEGLTRVTVDSRPTTARNAFRIILDEVGYMMVTGMSVIPAQARSLNISMVFAAQTYSDIKRGSPEEAEAIWGNTNFKFIGRITDGDNGDTFTKAKGASGETEQTYIDGYHQKENFMGDLSYMGSTVARRERRSRLDYDDIAGQQDGQFTLIVPKKEQGGKTQGARVVHLQGLFTGGGAESEYMYINDLIPVSNTEKIDDGSHRLQLMYYNLLYGNFNRDMNNAVSTNQFGNKDSQQNELKIPLISSTVLQIEEKIQSLTTASANDPVLKMPLSTVYITYSHLANLINPVNTDELGVSTDILDKDIMLSDMGGGSIENNLGQTEKALGLAIENYEPVFAPLQYTFEKPGTGYDAFSQIQPKKAEQIEQAKQNQDDLTPIKEQIALENDFVQSFSNVVIEDDTVAVEIPKIEPNDDLLSIVNQTIDSSKMEQARESYLTTNAPVIDELDDNKNAETDNLDDENSFNYTSNKGSKETTADIYKGFDNDLDNE